MKMMNLFFLIVLGLALHSKAEGPLYKQKDTYTQQEFDNVYQDLRSVRNASPAKIQSQTSTGTYCDFKGGSLADTFECFENGALTQLGPGDGDFEIYPSTTNTNAFLQYTYTLGQPVLQSRNSTFKADLGSATFPFKSLYVSSGVVGTTTNDSASSGYVGEFISTNTAITSTQTITTQNVYQNYLSIVLTAGDWNVDGILIIRPNGATSTEWDAAISVNSGNTTTDQVYGNNMVFKTAAASIPDTWSANINSYRLSLSGQTVVYLKGFGSFSAGNPQLYAGRISARRIR